MNKANLTFFTIISFFVFNSCSSKSKLSTVNERVDTLLTQMTLEEKIGQMNQYSSFWDVTGPAPKEGSAAVQFEQLKNGLVGSMLNVHGVENVYKLQKIAVEETRLGIPLIFGFDVIHGYKTITPIPLAEAASWDLEAIELSAKNAALEASAAGINWTFAPMVDVSRDARWGRVMEGGGEDPYLGSKIAFARVKGFQGDDLSNPSTIAACAKHFAGYGFTESGKEYNSVDVGTQTLYNVIMPPFKATIDAGVRTFMNSFSQLNGVPATGSKFLQRDILKRDWNFDGFVVSDWGSIEEMVEHGYAKDEKEAAQLAVEAGSDMDMQSLSYVENLADLVKSGIVDEKLIDDAARRILRVKFELGLFDDPYKYCDLSRESKILGNQNLHNASLDMAKKSIVLLKNQNQLLPLKKQGLNIALIGDLANDKTSPLGNWILAAEKNSAVSVLEGLKSYSGNNVEFSVGTKLNTGALEFAKELKINTTDKSDFAAALKLARTSDVVVMVLGEHGLQSGEGRSRTNIGLPGLQQELLEAVYNINKNIVLVLNNGRPLVLNWANKHIPAIVEAWQLGSQSGNAIAQVLYGDYNPSGKLPMTFPRSVGQVPIYYNYKSTGRPTLPSPGEVFWTHYQDEENTPLYPFGYGLSYTTFGYKNLKIQSQTDTSIKVSVEVTNTGNLEGKEVVQLYVKDHFARPAQAVRNLKGFELINLKPGETKTVQFLLTEKELGFYNNNGDFTLQSGEFSAFVGGDSTADLSTNFSL
ncbi:MAG: beta-glucosidase BglX [Bacteroidetes bacterium]|nr:beta-glucosidase BglX [Bacteroidota bacterium]MDA0860536.1 beta-glucosidase BglX [Bacteroidota bacterium]MDA1318300.1 beta-glucosidase BglX [Bacteroidota bacterium]